MNTDTLEQRAKAAAEDISRLDGVTGLLRQEFAAIILRHFADVQGGSEKLMPFKNPDAVNLHAELMRVCELIVSERDTWKALAQSSDDGRKELVEALKQMLSACGNAEPGTPQSFACSTARAALRNAGERGK